ncbi:hypothetical protein DJ018_13215 [Phenylobacterium deserti]|uniref:Uncharacterized protein n=1 Tax=Phenylobacterium deserti TaxID=1914756 RepID=A0A328ABW9_9CAUL|nr:hypothetical protein DJ018_13215 [Phenylobacterium deserti]
MRGENWMRSKRILGAVTRACALVPLWALVAFAWLLRKTLTPAARIAGTVEDFALTLIERLRGEG